MYRKCTTEISVQHQKQVEDSLLELMQKMPYEDITVTQLCSASGVSRRIFYHLFNNKADALCALVDHRILGMESYLSEASDQALRFFCYWKEQKNLLDALRDNQMANLLMERMAGIIVYEAYDVRYWLNVEDREYEKEILVFNLCGVMGLVYSWYESGYRKSPEEMAALMKRLMNRPLAKTT